MLRLTGRLRGKHSTFSSRTHPVGALKLCQSPVSQSPLGGTKLSYPDPKNPYGPPPEGPPPEGQSPYGPPPPYAQDPYAQQQPYGQDPYAQQQPYGPDPYAQQPYGQQAPYGQQPGYGYPPQGPPYGMPQRMPGQVIAARVLLFVCGGLWVVCALLMLLVAIMTDDLNSEDLAGVEDAAIAVALIFFVISAGLAALHIVPAALFGKGRTATRVVAIVAASLNSLIAVLAMLTWLGSLNQDGSGGGSPALGVIWVATAIVTLVFCGGSQANQWFKRPQL